MAQHCVRLAFADWCARRKVTGLARVILYRAVLRSRYGSMREVMQADMRTAENSLHVLLLAFGMTLDATRAAKLLRRMR